MTMENLYEQKKKKQQNSYLKTNKNLEIGFVLFFFSCHIAFF